MKREIQDKQRKILEGLSAKEQARMMREEIPKHPALRRIWEDSRRIKNRERSSI